MCITCPPPTPDRAHQLAATATLKQFTEWEGAPLRKVPTKTPLGGTLLTCFPGSLCASGQDAEPWITGCTEPVPQSSGFLGRVRLRPGQALTRAAHLLAARLALSPSACCATPSGPEPRPSGLAPPHALLSCFLQPLPHRSPRTNAGTALSLAFSPVSWSCTSQPSKGADRVRECPARHCLALGLSRGTHSPQ